MIYDVDVCTCSAYVHFTRKLKPDVIIYSHYKITHQSGTRKVAGQQTEHGFIKLQVESGSYASLACAIIFCFKLMHIFEAVSLGIIMQKHIIFNIICLLVYVQA